MRHFVQAWDQNLEELPKATRAELESILLAFDQAWPVDLLERWLTDRLASCEQEIPREIALVELIKVDLERQWAAGNEKTVEAYLAQFPQLRELHAQYELVRAEHQARRLCGAAAEIKDFQHRFPELGEALQNLLADATQSQLQSTTAASVDTSRSQQLAETQDAVSVNKLGLPEQFGRYRILKKLGEGAMGAVYQALDTQLDRKVAIKTPTFQGDESGELVERFFREARSAATLSHANICPVHDAGEIDGINYIAMAYTRGYPLSAFIRDDKLLPERAVASVIRKLALALQHAHEHGIVHRDLKPGNIMIDQKKEPVVMDFGLARREGGQDDVRMTQTGMILGTPAYMSPEQIDGRPEDVTAQSDIYSLGVILYEMLTGQLPFQGSIPAIMAQALKDEPQPPSTHRADLDADLQAICLKMMAKRREDRDDREDVKLADFGLARVYQTSRFSGLTLQGEMGGSLPFMPPEHLSNYREAKPPGDQFAVAATLYNWLTDQYIHDFPERTGPRVLAVLQNEAVPIRQRRAEIPEALASLIHQALDRKPERRFSSAAIMRDQLLPFAVTNS